MPPLAGLSQGYFLQQMRAYRDGTRPASLMQQIARGFDAAQTEALAAYFERQSPAP
jgi:cytochrome c553